MVTLKRFIGIGVALGMTLYLLAAVLGFGGAANQAVAGSTGDTGIDDSVNWSANAHISDGKLIIEIKSDKPLFMTHLLFMGNSGGITSAASKGQTEFFAKGSSSDKHHVFCIPLSEIKCDDATVRVSADIIAKGTLGERDEEKVVVSKVIAVPKVVVTTTEKEKVTTTTEKQVAATTTTEKERVAATTTTEKAAVTTTVLAVTTTIAPTTTVPQVVTTVPVTVPVAVVEREVLPITGTQYNWYLIGAMIALIGAGLYLGSLKSAKQES